MLAGVETGCSAGVLTRAHLPQTANMLLSAPTPEDSTSRLKRWLSYASIVALISAATAVMMLCPCDVVGIRHHYAVSLVALAALFGIAAASLVYRRLKRDSGTTAFLRAVIALAIVAVSIYAELWLAMEIVAWMAQRR